MLTDRKYRRQRAYLLAEGQLLGGIMVMLLYRLWGPWALLGWLMVVFTAWTVNWVLADRERGQSGE